MLGSSTLIRPLVLATALLGTAAFLGALPLSAAALDETRIDSLLVVERVGEGRRSPVMTDALESILARGEWTTPAEGDALPLPDGTSRTWRRVAAKEDGTIEDAALRGGYGLATFEAAEECVLILEARGHRHVYVNGEPRVGDLYDLGITRVPVHAHAGANELLFQVARGRLRARLVPPPAPVYFESQDRTLPDALVGDAGSLDAAVLVTNASLVRRSGLRIVATTEGGTAIESPVPPLSPVSFRKIPFKIALPIPVAGERVEVTLELHDSEGTVLHATDLALDVRSPRDKHRRTFVSRIDGSVQYYAVTPPAGEPSGDAKPALFLSLHGAAVEATNQAYAYAPKDWGFVVAPTNRRPYGFDWEDWGRLDALEVLAIAAEAFSADPLRTYLTGHSMGGHGTWNLGVHEVNRFAAIAPSAGWRDFWSYSGATEWPDADPVEALLARASNASRTLLLESNLEQFGVYVLHGELDATVPVDEARFMRKRLGEFHTNFAYYERPGAGHWWGNECMDWPPLFDFLRRNRRPEDHEIRDVTFVTVNPGVASRCRWVVVEAQERSMEPSRIEAEIQPASRKIVARSENIVRLAFDLAPFAMRRTVEREGRSEDATILPAGEPITVEIDGKLLEAVPWPAREDTLRLERDREAGWRVADLPVPAWKGPRRAGPFKDAFRNHVMFVYGTRGTLEENTWAAAKARYDAEVFWYRGNGSIDVVADDAFDPAAEPDRGVILYGNADTNAAWAAVLANAPFEMRRGSVRFGDRAVEGEDLAALVVYPRAGSDVACVGVVGGTGAVGMRLTNQFPYFVSGAGYPDWMVIGATMLERGSEGVLGAGFFDDRWQAGADAAWR